MNSRTTSVKTCPRLLSPVLLGELRLPMVATICASNIYLQLCLVLLSVITCVSPVLLSAQLCPANAPCSCAGRTINCRSFDFHNVTYFDYINVDGYDTLDYGNNSVLYLPASSFASLTLRTLILDDNNIASMHEMTFHGLEKDLVELNLANNNLSAIPVAISRLRALRVLNISGNPIGDVQNNFGTTNVPVDDSFSSSVMGNISDTLEVFSFGHISSLRHWPQALSKLHRLKSVTIEGSNIDLLYEGSFHGFTGTLRSLTITHGHFKQIPVAIGELQHLDELHFDHNINIRGDRIIIKQPFQEINGTLKILSLNYNNLTTFPLVIKYLKVLQYLSLEGNNFTYISEESIFDLKTTNVSILNLRNCGIRRVPGSFSQLSRLVELDLSFNRIKTIEYRDLENLPVLVFLSLRGNPLKDISQSAFHGLSSLRQLDLSEVTMTTIPKGIQNLISLEVLDLSNSNIECTCELTWLKIGLEMLEKAIRIDGRCENIDSFIEQYVMNRIPSCPDYMLSEV